MRLRFGTVTLLASASLLAACGAALESQQVYEDASGATPPADAYHRALYEGYMEHATYEQEEMMHYDSAIVHSQKAIAASRGETPAIAQVTDFGPQPADKVDELTQARAQLAAALNAGGAQRDPQAAGRAQSFYDCWAEQQQENFQPRDIAYCRDGFYKNVQMISGTSPTADTPEVQALQTDALFDFDRAVVKDEFKPALNSIAQQMVADTTTEFLVWGHTDTAGPANYNQGLSERRAEAVAEYLESQGVTRDRLVIRGFGEENLAVQTPDDMPNAQNRRVEVRRR
jgi:OOP family OmpA-OmpF porin